MSGASARPWKRVLRRAALFVGVSLAVGACGTGVFSYAEASAYDESVAKVYDVAPLPLARSSDPAVIARGSHLAQSLAGCAMSVCHGPDLTGGHVTEGGPIGRTVTPNVSVVLPAYTDGELARLIRHAIKKDGRTVRFMPVDNFAWLPDDDVVALISWLRTVPPKEHLVPPMEIKPFGKVMDRMGYIPIDLARRLDHEHPETGPAPAPTAEYGKWIAHACRGCHGERMSGGPLPGTPPGFPVPANVTPHASGIGGWAYDDFVHVIETGTRKEDGKPLDEFMPVEMLRNMDDTERRAIWAYLESLPPVPFGQR